MDFIFSYMLYQHVPSSFAKMNEYLPNHLYFSNVTAPVCMTQVPASLLLNRFVMKRRIKFGRPDERNQRRMAFVRSESALACVWMPFNDYVVTAWNNGKIVKLNGVNYQYSGQQDVIALFCVHL
jgi:singapore isolate B (sub-type 7) whole genome shotgun sequence assembly, scaffold_27